MKVPLRSVIHVTLTRQEITIYCLLLPVMMTLIEGQEQSIFPENGYYSYHPAYYHDLPPARPLPDKIPFGLPVGGYSASGNGPPYGLVAFYFDAYGQHFDFNNPWSYLLLKQLIKLSSEITARFVPIDNSLMDGPLIWTTSTKLK